jgi:hypothetical protein
LKKVERVMVAVVCKIRDAKQETEESSGILKVGCGQQGVRNKSPVFKWCGNLNVPATTPQSDSQPLTPLRANARFSVYLWPELFA